MRFASLLPSTISAATFIGLTLTVPPTLAADLQSDLKPLLEAKCLACHNPNNPKGDLSLATAAAVLDPEKRWLCGKAGGKRSLSGSDPAA